MMVEFIPSWMENLESEDLTFIKNFILASGSLKEMAKIYKVTYSTVRLRLDKIIQKIQINEDTNKEPYISLIQRLALDDKLSYDVAKILVSAYKKTKKE